MFGGFLHFNGEFDHDGLGYAVIKRLKERQRFLGIMLAIAVMMGAGLRNAEAGDFAVVYQGHEVPGLSNPIAHEYLSLMPQLPRDRSWVKGVSAYVFSPEDGDENRDVYELALILVYTTSPGVGEFSSRDDGLEEAYLILARRTGENLASAIQSRVDSERKKEEYPYIPYDKFPEFNKTNLSLLAHKKIYSYGEVLPPHYLPAWGECYSYPRYPERRLEGQRGTWLRLFPLTSSDSLDIAIQLEHQYLAVCQLQDDKLNLVFNSLMRARDAGTILPEKDVITREGFVRSICLDLNDDGLYELLISNDAYQDGFPSGDYFPFISCYRWNGNQFIEDNSLFYQSDYARPLLETYLTNYRLLVEHMIELQKYPPGRRSPAIIYPYFYEFHIGLLFYYREEWHRAGFFLNRSLDGPLDDSCVDFVKNILEKIKREIERLD